MTRRSALQTIPAALAAAQAGRTAPTPAPSGRLKQSLCRWCYSKIPLDDLCRQAAEMGVTGMDLVEPPDWPTVRKYGLAPTVTPGRRPKIPDGWNRKESHERLEQRNSCAHHAARRRPRCRTSSPSPAIARAWVTTKGKENCIVGLKPRSRNSLRTKASRCCWNCSIARSTTRTTCATTPPGAWM